MRAPLYDLDLNAWAEDQARILHEGRIDDLDHDRLSEVIAGLGERDRRELRDRLEILLTGLLRWAEQVDLRCHGWAASIGTQRGLIAHLLRDSPSLHALVPSTVAEAYEPARRRAVLESGLFDTSFSASCPFSEAEILTEGHLPDPYGDDAVRGEGWWRRR